MRVCGGASQLSLEIEGVRVTPSRMLKCSCVTIRSVLSLR